MGYSIETKCLHLEKETEILDIYGAVSFPM